MSDKQAQDAISQLELNQQLIDATTEIVCAFVSQNDLQSAQVPVLIRDTFAALQGLLVPATAEVAEQQQKPAVNPKKSVFNDYIICLEDGKKLTMLKRYLRTHYSMTPEEYRAKWGLASDYPMVAPAYAERRRTVARRIGLGRQEGAARGGRTPNRKAAQAK